MNIRKGCFEVEIGLWQCLDLRLVRWLTFDHDTLIIGALFVTLYIKLSSFLGNDTSYGIWTTKDSLVLTWGHWQKFIRMPWEWVHFRTMERLEVPLLTWAEKNLTEPTWVVMPLHAKDGCVATKHSYPYHYILATGKIQDRAAIVWVKRMQWKWRWFGFFLPWPTMDRQYLEVVFDDEVGERTGSWKGGVIGCSERMEPGETCEQTLRRMEAARKFT